MSDLKDFLEFRGLDLRSGQRGVDLMKEFTSAQDLGEEYGYDVRIPSLGGLTVNEFALQNRDKLIPEGQEIIKRKGKEYLVDKDRPKGPMALAAGFMDLFDPEADRDKLGGMGQIQPDGTYAYNPVGGLTEFDPKDLSQLKLNPSQKRKAEKLYRQQTAGMGTPTDTIDDAMKAYFDYKKKSDSTSRKGRILDNALDFINMRVQTPFVMDTLKDASTFKQQQLLDAEAIKQGLAKEVQNRAVQSAAAAAVLRQATAAQQDAATRFAQVGLRQPTATFSA
mgnify:CR=1 FL=1|tara:strand:- start:387 stop:1223 length:837 start_codon:yes stop_codon:yes gene_type:complete